MLPYGSATGWEGLFWFVFNRSAHPMALVDEQQRIVDGNGALLELGQRTRKEMLGTRATELMPQSARTDAEKQWPAIIGTESGAYHGTGTLLRPDESEVDLEFAARATRIGERRLVLLVTLSVPEDPVFSGQPRPAKGLLTNREREVVSLIAMGRETPEIGEELHIAPATVRTHVRNAMSKFDAHTRAELVARVLSEEGLLDLPRRDD